ncbi:uncharacterized protein PHALS_13960 [Plasmopara halstedii]|uniref:Uncharacterized protein n=1 Tax=Plasmopara halstedii TaxID=4781 RepID=A0A0P1AQZ2_PLAHL|nr:uncharacterized protein PHALS_13960 [Plasmopara halstedii]CEG43663.1 hypothetical protein PHALS_13960 [Plasmopara halstedii]|eukprot:XP_024580032.1 hypothetical protein PHALS_13960 [Plasmopara halstedii]
MSLTHLPSLQHHQLPLLPSLRTSHHSLQRQQTPRMTIPVTISDPVDLTLTGPLRRGKWTRAEEDYAAATISYFCDGVLAIQYGTTLRGYLAQQLHCDPMRISKKLLPGSVFAGIKINPKIGRRAYYPRAQDSLAAAHFKETAAHHLRTLRHAFLQSIEDEEHVIESQGLRDQTIKMHQSPKPLTSSDRKRSYDDINSVVRTQQQPQTYEDARSTFYGFQNQVQSALFTPRLTGVTNETLTSAISPVMCKLPKLTISDNVSYRASYYTQQRSVSPVTVATSTAVLPPLHISLVRASMC